MSRRLPWVVILLAAAPLAVSLTLARQEKRVETTWINTNFAAPPGTLRDMSIKADAVVRGRVLGGQPKDADLKGAPGGRPLTMYRIKVLEILSAFGGRSVPDSELTVVREGGDRDRGKVIERTIHAGFPQFTLGGEYVLFLRWNDEFAAWQPAWGPSGVFRLNAGRVESIGDAAPTSARFKDLQASEFLERLRRLE